MKNNKSKIKHIIIVNREKFIESVYHIVLYGNLVRTLEATLNNVASKVNKEEIIVIKNLVHWNVMINVISLLDEINKFLFKYKDDNDTITTEKIKEFKYIIEPVLKEISKWKDFRKYRNNVLAHNFRIDSENFKSVHLSNKIDSYNSPTKILDLPKLFKLINTITKIAEQMFKDEYKEAINIVDSFNNTIKKSIEPFEESVNEMTSEVNIALLEVNKRTNEYNKKLN